MEIRFETKGQKYTDARHSRGASKKAPKKTKAHLCLHGMCCPEFVGVSAYQEFHAKTKIPPLERTALKLKDHAIAELIQLILV